MTIEEIAKQLGVSKSTVSRALSGKGRIGEATRARILEFAGKSSANPNGRLQVETKQSSESNDQDEINNTASNYVEKIQKTGNIAVVLPADAYITGSPYFHECLLGICETARLMHYDVMVATVTDTDISSIERLVERHKVDGVILTRSMENNRIVQYLIQKQIPVALTGTTDIEGVIQVDTDNKGAAENLTRLLVSFGYRRFAAMFENLQYTVDRQRYEGFCNALYQSGIEVEKQKVYTGMMLRQGVDSLVSDLLSRKVECLICGDDILCTKMMTGLLSAGYRIPMDIGVASLYNSVNLNCFTPSVTAVNIMAREIGNAACKELIHAMNGQEYSEKSQMDYEVLVRKSTSRNHIH